LRAAATDSTCWRPLVEVEVVRSRQLSIAAHGLPPSAGLDPRQHRPLQRRSPGRPVQPVQRADAEGELDRVQPVVPRVAVRRETPLEADDVRRRCEMLAEVGSSNQDEQTATRVG